jgi:hypothetical protein
MKFEVEDFGLKYCADKVYMGLTSTGRHPRFPKNLAGQKVSFKVSPTKSDDYPTLNGLDF